MTNKIFKIRQRKINKYFSKNKKEFITLLSKNPNLKKYKNLINEFVPNNLLLFCNTLIYLYGIDHDIEIKNNKYFQSKYIKILKAITLLSIGIKNINIDKINIFKYDFVIRNSNIKIENLVDKSSGYYDNLTKILDIVYSFVYYLYDVIKFEINFDKFYELIFNVVLLLYIKNDMREIKKYCFGLYKKRIPNFSEYKTQQYLKLLKFIRSSIESLFKQFLNDLIYVLNL